MTDKASKDARCQYFSNGVHSCPCGRLNTAPVLNAETVQHWAGNVYWRDTDERPTFWTDVPHAGPLTAQDLRCMADYMDGLELNRKKNEEAI